MKNVWTLFWNFFLIGLFTFGGGYAMIPMIEEVAVREGWIASASELYSWVGIAEGTPGPFAVNITTLLGFQNAGFFGALFATLGVILPSWIILVLIASFGKKLLETKYATAALKGLRPVVIGLITVVVIGLIYQNLFQTGLDLWNLSAQGFDYFSLIIGILVFGVSLIKIKQKALSPIFLIILSGVLGIIFYQVVGL